MSRSLDRSFDRSIEDRSIFAIAVPIVCAVSGISMVDYCVVVCHSTGSSQLRALLV